MVPVYRKDLRKIVFEYLTWIHDFKNNQIFWEIMDTKERFFDAESFDWKEATEEAVNKVLNKLFREQSVPKTVGGHSKDGLEAYYRI